MVGVIFFMHLAFGIVFHHTGEDSDGKLIFFVGRGTEKKTLVCQALRGYGVGP